MKLEILCETGQAIKLTTFSLLDVNTQNLSCFLLLTWKKIKLGSVLDENC